MNVLATTMKTADLKVTWKLSQLDIIQGSRTLFLIHAYKISQGKGLRDTIKPTAATESNLYLNNLLAFETSGSKYLSYAF